MRQQDAQVQHNCWHVAVKVDDTVDDAQRQPGQSKQEENQKQRLGRLELPSIKGTCLFGARNVLTEFVSDDTEDVEIDGAHDDQGDENPSEEAEIDHIVHPDDRTELARKIGNISGVP